MTRDINVFGHLFNGRQTNLLENPRSQHAQWIPKTHEGVIPYYPMIPDWQPQYPNYQIYPNSDKITIVTNRIDDVFTKFIVIKEKDRLNLSLELPGVVKDDINVLLEDGRKLTVTADISVGPRKNQKIAETYQFDTHVDDSDVKIVFDACVLCIDVKLKSPKKSTLKIED